ncbi:MAG: tetratricopeptide repeat protein [Myxococcales bacterium]|nr:tetratricopeptide repeat protein [Myxococcales bacterium]
MRGHLRAAVVAGLVTLAAATAGAVSARELLGRALAAEARGDLPTAARSLEELVAAGVDSDGVLYDLGTVYARQERYGEAIWCFERVLRRAPLMWPARDNLRATRMRLARRDAGRSGQAVVEQAVPLRVQVGELVPLGWSVLLGVLGQIGVVFAVWRRRRVTSELEAVGMTVALVLSLTLTAGALGLVAARRALPAESVVLHGGLRLRQTARVDGIPDAAVREGERVERVARDGVFTRVRTLTGATGWLETSELGGL